MIEVLGIPRGAPPENGVATPSLADEPEASLADLDERQRAEELSDVIVSASTALQFLHAGGVVHGDLSPEKIILARDRRWLIEAGAPDDEDQFADAALRDVQALIEMLIAIYCDEGPAGAPTLKPAVRAGLTHREAARYETLLVWAWFRVQSRTPEQRTPERIAYLLDCLKEYASVDEPPRETDGYDPGDMVTMPYDWLVLVDTYHASLDNRDDMERRLRMVETLPDNEDLLNRGLDDYWRAYIEEAVDERLREIDSARQLLQHAASGTPVDETDKVFAEEIVLNYEEEGNPAREDLIRCAIDEAAQLRARIIEQGVVSQDACARSLGVTQEELHALLRGGQIVAVLDHEQLLFPRFQFHSPETLRVVAEVGEWQGAAYPSWLWASRWFLPLDTHRGQTAAELLQRGKVQELTADLWEAPDPDSLRTVA